MLPNDLRAGLSTARVQPGGSLLNAFRAHECPLGVVATTAMRKGEGAVKMTPPCK